MIDVFECLDATGGRLAIFQKLEIAIESFQITYGKIEYVTTHYNALEDAAVDIFRGTERVGSIVTRKVYDVAIGL